MPSLQTYDESNNQLYQRLSTIRNLNSRTLKRWPDKMHSARESLAFHMLQSTMIETNDMDLLQQYSSPGKYLSVHGISIEALRLDEFL